MAIVAILFAWGALTIIRLPDSKAIEHAARAWIKAHPGAIESDSRTVGALTLLPEARALPPVGSGRAFRLILTNSTCADLVRRLDASRPLRVRTDAPGKRPHQLHGKAP